MIIRKRGVYVKTTNAKELFRKFVIKYSNHWLSEREYRKWLLVNTNQIPEIEEQELIDFIAWETALSRDDIMEVLDAEFLFLKKKGVII